MILRNVLKTALKKAKLYLEFSKGGHWVCVAMTTGWDGFSRRRREIFWVPLCALWDPAFKIIHGPTLNGIRWAYLGCMLDGNGTGSLDAFHQWGAHGNPHKPR